MKEVQRMHDKFIRLLKLSKKNPEDKEIRKQLSSVWRQMDSYNHA